MLIETHFLLPLYILMIQGIFGAVDTLYYNEYKYRLPLYCKYASNELYLHGVRDLLYGVLFLTLPRWQWGGAWAWVLALILCAEIIITLTDFIIERHDRKPWGGLAHGELLMHTWMAILYGIFLTSFFPHWWNWLDLSSEFIPHSISIAIELEVGMTLMGIGVFLAGLRDLSLASSLVSVDIKKRMLFPWGLSFFQEGHTDLESPPLVGPFPPVSSRDKK